MDRGHHSGAPLRLLLYLVCVVALPACGAGPTRRSEPASATLWLVQLPLPGGAHLPVSVPAALRFVTSPFGAWLLDGRELDTAVGIVTIHRALGRPGSLSAARPVPRADRLAWVIGQMQGVKRAQRTAALGRPLVFATPSSATCGSAVGTGASSPPVEP